MSGSNGVGGLGGELALPGRLLDAAALRQRTIAANLAHQSTPGWQRLEVRFEEALGEALDRGGVGEALKVTPEVQVDETATPRLDGNSVDPEQELVDMSKNALLYHTLTRAAASKVAQLRAAITGR